MALFTIGDLHLSFNCEKPMDIFAGWQNYTDKLCENWNRMVGQEDLVVVVGDISWAMNIEQALADFQFLNALPGKKVVLKGNHDYYWTTMKKMEEFLTRNGLETISILHNNHFVYDSYRLCGSRGWTLDNGDAQTQKMILREESRLDASYRSAAADEGEMLTFLHYPPIFHGKKIEPLIRSITNSGSKRCYFGHVHGKSAAYAPKGTIDGVYYELVSCDYTEFAPVKIG